MIEYAPGRFLVAKRIVGCNIYTKNNEVKVAITVDTVNAEERTVFTPAFQSDQEARTFIQNVNNQL